EYNRTFQKEQEEHNMVSKLYGVKSWWKILPALALVLGMLAGINSVFAGMPVGSSVGNSPAAPAQSGSNAGGPSTPFDCSQLSALGVDKQLNFHAAQTLAGCGYQPKPGSVAVPGNSWNGQVQ